MALSPTGSISPMSCHTNPGGRFIASHPVDPKILSEFDLEVNTSIFGFGIFEFLSMPLFLYMGYNELTSLGTKFVYLVYVVVVLATYREVYWLSRIDQRAWRASRRLWSSKWKLPGNIETPVPLFVKEFITSIPQYTDNMVLSLAIGDISRQWNQQLESWWIFTWRTVPLAGAIARVLSLPTVLFCLMFVSLMLQMHSWLTGLAKRQNATAAQVANLSVLALIDVAYMEEVPHANRVGADLDGGDDVTKRAADGSLTVLERAHIAALVVRCDASVARCQNAIKNLVNNLGRANEADDFSDEVPASDYTRLPTDQEQRLSIIQAKLAASRRRFLVKVITGCSPRLWFKASMEILLVKTGNNAWKMMAVSIATSLVHVAFGAEPYLGNLWEHTRDNRAKFWRELLLILICIFPVWGSMIRLAGLWTCPSGIFAFTVLGCVSADSEGFPNMTRA